MNTPKPYIIGAFDHGSEANRFFDSLEKILGDTVRPIMLMYLSPDGKYDEDVRIPKNVTLIKANKRYPGNTGRHKDLREVVLSMNLDKDAWCIFTDIHDVVFQTPLPDLPADADILVCDEGKTFGEIEFWKAIFPQDVWKLRAYNSGVWAMKYPVLMEFWDSLYNDWMKFFDWYKHETLPKISPLHSFPFEAPILDKQIKNDIAKLFNGYQDTLAFIEFIEHVRNGKYRLKELSGLFACYAFQYDLDQVVEKERETYLMSGEKVCIVHYNGDSKKHLRRREA